MRVLVACEESQRVTIAFRERGHLAFSCDLKDCSGGFPQYHIKADCRSVIESNSWDLLIAHPPCTYFSRMNFLNYYRHGKFNEDRFRKAMPYVELFNYLWNCSIPRICIENPVPFKLFENLLPPYTMYFQPYEFGENKSKKTCLWLKNLPDLMPTLHVLDHTPLITVHNSFELFDNISDQSTYRSKTFEGVARAMAEQWGCLEPLACACARTRAPLPRITARK